MGKERDKLIRLYGGVPISEEQPSDTELMRRYMESYAREGRLLLAAGTGPGNFVF